MSVKITIPNTSADYLTFGSANTPDAAKIGGYDDGSSAGHLEFYTTTGGTSTERMRIDSSGNVGIGTSSPNAKLDVVGGIKSSGTNGFITGGNEFNFASNYSTSVNGDLYVNYQGSAKTLVRYMFQRGDASGTYIPLLASAFTVSSDYRIKSNVTPLENGALDKIGKLNPVTYNLFDETKTSIGLIAHEVQEIIPEAVTGEKDAIDEDGDDSYQSVDYSQVAIVLVKAIQELKAELDTVKSELATLKGTV